MRVEVERETPLWFAPGAPVRAASAIAALSDGWLVAQDDATHAAWLRLDGITAVRVAEPVEGHETFSSAEGTKHLKPDFEAAVAVGAGVLLLGSGSTPARMRGSLVTGAGAFTTIDLTPVYGRVAAALGLPLDRLNLEGAARVADRVRWFQRGNSAAGVPSGAVDVPLSLLLPRSALRPAETAGRGELSGPDGSSDSTRPDESGRSGMLGDLTGPGPGRPGRLGGSTGPGRSGESGGSVAVGGMAGPVEVGGVGRSRRYDLGAVRGVALAVTDAVALPDGRLLVAAAAEDTPNAIDDGPVVGAALALLDDERVLAVAAVPDGAAGPYKIEGLAIRGLGPGGVSLIAVVDADDPLAASSRLDLRVSW